MASPSDSARQGTNVTTASTTHNVNVGSPTAGTLLIVLSRFAAAPGAITFTGYTQLALDSSDASDDTTAVWYRWADGTEGASDVLNPTNSVKGAHLSWEITGAEHPGLQVPEISAVAVGTTTLNTANPNSRAVTGGPKDVLYIAMHAQDGEVAATASPTNYSAITTANSGTTGNTNTNVVIGGGSRAISASSSDDPGAFTHAAAPTGWTAFTVVIHPAGSTPFLQTGFKGQNILAQSAKRAATY